MASTLRQELAELKKLKTIQSRLSEKTSEKRQSSNLEVIKQVATATAGNIPGAKALSGLIEAPSAVRRGALTGGGTAIGGLTGPVGAGVGAAVGGTLADVADTAESPKLQEAVAKSFKEFGFSKELAQNLTQQAIQSMSKDDIVTFLKKRGGEFASGALLTGGANKIVKTVAKSVRKGSAGAVKTGFDDPTLATKVGKKQAERALKNLKNPILRKEPLKNVQDLRKQLGAPKGQLELVLSLEAKLAAGTKLSNAELLLGREAARKVTKRGGSNAELAGKIFKKIASETEKRFPGASKKFKKVEKTIKAEKEAGGESPKSLIGAIGSLKGKGLVKLLIPEFGAKTGANLRKLLAVTPSVGTGAIAPIIQALLNRKEK